MLEGEVVLCEDGGETVLRRVTLRPGKLASETAIV